MRLFGDFEYAARSWPQAFRVVVKAEVLAGSGGLPDKDNERFVVTSLRGPSPRALYQQDYCARGQAENLIKQVKCDLKSDRTSASSFLANFARLLLTAGAYVLHQQLRQLGLQGTPLATAQPRTVILSLFKIAARVKQYKDRGWRRSAGDFTRPAGRLPCWLLHDPTRLAHETAPPALASNDFTINSASGGRGLLPENRKIFQRGGEITQ